MYVCIYIYVYVYIYIYIYIYMPGPPPLPSMVRFFIFGRPRRPPQTHTTIASTETTGGRMGVPCKGNINHAQGGACHGPIINVAIVLSMGRLSRLYCRKLCFPYNKTMCLYKQNTNLLCNYLHFNIFPYIYI